LLIVSISFNFIFMYNPANSLFKNILSVILCIIFDVAIILICEIAFTIRLNLTFVKNENISIFSRVGNIFSSMVDNKLTKIENKVNRPLVFVHDKDTRKELSYRLVSKDENNNNLPEFVQDKDTAKNIVNKHNPENKNLSTFVQDKEIETIKSAIFSYKDGNLCPSLSALSDITGITKNKIVEAKKILEKRGLIKTKDMKTYVLGEIENV